TGAVANAQEVRNHVNRAGVLEVRAAAELWEVRGWWIGVDGSDVIELLAGDAVEGGHRGIRVRDEGAIVVENAAGVDSDVAGIGGPGGGAVVVDGAAESAVGQCQRTGNRAAARDCSQRAARQFQGAARRTA